MENRNCKKCGTIFQYIDGYPLCKDCSEKDEQDFQRVKEYVWSNPGANIEQVAKALEMEPRQILRYLQEERLEVYFRSEKYLLCELCGNVIRTGRFCDNCKTDINKQLNRESSGKLGDIYYYDKNDEVKVNRLKNEAYRLKKQFYGGKNE